MFHSERRKHRRYLVEGKAVISALPGLSAAELVEVSRGGVRVLTPGGPVRLGEQINIRFAIDGYPLEVNATGRVARVDIHSIAIEFIDPPVEVDKTILWLEAGLLFALVVGAKAVKRSGPTVITVGYINPACRISNGPELRHTVGCLPARQATLRGAYE